MTEEIEEKRVNIRTAILAKEKGFNLHCDWCYNEHCVEEQVGNINFVDDDKYITFSSPRQTLLQKWLREVHKLYVIPDIIYDDKNSAFDKFVYKAVNLYGDGVKAQEYYNDNRPSQLNNNTLHLAQELTDQQVIDSFEGTAKPIAKTLAPIQQVKPIKPVVQVKNAPPKQNKGGLAAALGMKKGPCK